MELLISDNPDPVAAGQNVTYTIDYANNGPKLLTGVILTSFLPENTIFISASSGRKQRGETVVWEIGQLEPGESGTVEVTVHIPQDSDEKLIFIKMWSYWILVKQER
ncbi:MAG: DUF11 domain-containing protein [Actinomycetota bacterium]|nr:DUF11 domain-containing protein [Actinomycetota bacterium]